MHLDALERTLEGETVDLVHVEPLWRPIHGAYVEREEQRPAEERRSPD
jgi:hypothetical protein